MSKILCPVDFSETSLNAIEYAKEIASKNQAVLTLLYVFTEDEFNKIVDKTTIAKSYKELLAIATKKLELLAESVNEEYSSQGRLNCEAEVVLGDLHEAVLAKCNDKEYDMVVMGTTGVGKNVWLGSNTSYIIQKSPIAILCVPSKSQFNGFKKIVYATDIQEEDKVMMQEVLSLGILFNSRITVLHVSQQSSQLEKSVVKEFFDELSSFLKYHKIGYDSIVHKGSLSQGLLEYMDQKNGNLLAVFSKKRNFVDNLLHRSVSKKLSVLSEQPLLVLK